MCVKCAKRVIQALDNAEAQGAFDNLTRDEKETERQLLGMKIRAEITCPADHKEEP